MKKLKQTPSQTIGPYFAYGLTPEAYGRSGIASNVLIQQTTRGERLRLHGQVLDGDGEPVTDALLEIWQADHMGRYYSAADGGELETGFTGFGRRGTDDNGMYSFITFKPGRVAGGDDGTVSQAPHINMIVFMRGILSHAYTRIYFSDEPEANQADPVLSTVGPERRATLIAERDDSHEIPRYRFDVNLQGENETVFFDV